MAPEEKHSQSIQAILGSLPFTCPYCSRKYNKHKDSVHTSGDHIEDQMASSCRYYSDLLSKKIIRFKQNVKRRLTNELDSFSPSNIYVEACTMKPSGRQDENLQVKIKKREIINQNCILSPTISAVDIRRNESHDLKTLYYMLTAIEGRVRRLKQNL
ncbi:uncharacterized protein LOC123692796 [Colias croceus]|uniref:uncharacterized protein LOC123692796 n=1 Tax=Colias crocea TaxID=72248 RepID=UPI001E27F73A|nr:uncharacterized protein LOC123692796 [Colias croceus]